MTTRERPDEGHYGGLNGGVEMLMLYLQVSCCRKEARGEEGGVRVQGFGAGIRRGVGIMVGKMVLLVCQ